MGQKTPQGGGEIIKKGRREKEKKTRKTERRGPYRNTKKQQVCSAEITCPHWKYPRIYQMVATVTKSLLPSAARPWEEKKKAEE